MIAFRQVFFFFIGLVERLTLPNYARIFRG